MFLHTTGNIIMIMLLYVALPAIVTCTISYFITAQMWGVRLWPISNSWIKYGLALVTLTAMLWYMLVNIKAPTILPYVWGVIVGQWFTIRNIPKK